MSKRTRKHKQAGFTLVEILVVIVILGLLATLVGSNVMKALFEAEGDTAKNQVLSYEKIIKEFVIRERRLPEGWDELIEEDQNGFAYIEGLTRPPVDPWQQPYEIRELERRNQFEVISYGPDAEPDTEDDISSRTAREADTNK